VAFEDLAEVLDPASHSVYVAIMYRELNRLRTRLLDAAVSMGFRPASYVSSRAFVWRGVPLGEHCFIFEHTTLQPFVSIGRNCVLWAGSHVAHHASLGNNIFLAPQVAISGSARIGDNCFIGINATIVNDIEIGADCWIGPSATITRDVEPNSVMRTPRATPRDIGAREAFEVTE